MNTVYPISEASLGLMYTMDMILEAPLHPGLMKGRSYSPFYAGLWRLLLKLLNLISYRKHDKAMLLSSLLWCISPVNVMLFAGTYVSKTQTHLVIV